MSINVLQLSHMRGVAVSWGKLTDVRRVQIQVSSWHALLVATYLASQEERVTMRCWQVDQVITSRPSEKQ